MREFDCVYVIPTKETCDLGYRLGRFYGINEETNELIDLGLHDTVLIYNLGYNFDFECYDKRITDPCIHIWKDGGKVVCKDDFSCLGVRLTEY